MNLRKLEPGELIDKYYNELKVDIKNCAGMNGASSEGTLNYHLAFLMHQQDSLYSCGKIVDRACGLIELLMEERKDCAVATDEQIIESPGPVERDWSEVVEKIISADRFHHKDATYKEFREKILEILQQSEEIEFTYILGEGL